MNCFYIMPFCHYTTPGIFSSSFISWRKATVWKSMNCYTIWYFFKDMYILARECNSLFEKIQCSLMKENDKYVGAYNKMCPVINQTTTVITLLLLWKLFYLISHWSIISIEGVEGVSDYFCFCVALPHIVRGVGKLYTAIWILLSVLFSFNWKT